MSVELHCHTVYSVDGKWIPEDLVDAAVANGVTTLAVTEHNNLDSLPRIQSRARHHGIRCLPGVEIDVVLSGHRVHVVALGFDPDHRPLQRLVEANHACYTLRYDIYVEVLAERGIHITQQQLDQMLAALYPTHPAPQRNIYALNAVLDASVPPIEDSSVVRSIESRVIKQRGPNAFGVYPQVKDVSDVVHDAGGILVLAHVAGYAPGDVQRQFELIDAGLAAGLDGFELWHWRNLAEPHFDQLKSRATSLSCVVTGGSDSHKPTPKLPAAQSRPGPGDLQISCGIMGRIDEALTTVRSSSRAGK